jgi:mono/diheme cytochrome c family protein
MKRIVIILLIVLVVVLAVIQVIDFYDAKLQAGRMWETPAIKPHEAPITAVAAGSVPFDGRDAFHRLAPPGSLQSPLDRTDPSIILLGQQGYDYYCVQCHGKLHDGNGTVGQSFAPLPGDLRSARIQQMADGLLFHEISFGIPGGRQPALASTIAVEERWQIIAFVKSLGVRE